MKSSAILTAAAALLLRAASAAPVPLGLYGMSDAVGLIRVFPGNGSSSPIGPPLPSEDQAQQLAVLDATRGIYYILGYSVTLNAPNLVGLSLADGSVISSAPLSIYESGLIGVGQSLAIEPATGRLIIAGRLSATGPHVVGFVDPKTGNFTQVASIDGALRDVLGATSAYDPLTNTLLLSLADAANQYFYAVDMKAGNSTRWPEVWETGGNIQTLDYHAASGSFLGLGITELGSNITRVLVRLDARNYTFSTVGVVPGYVMMMGPIAALDVAGDVLYWMGASIAAPDDGFFYVGLNIMDGSVASVSTARVYPEPWSLEWLNAGNTE